MKAPLIGIDAELLDGKLVLPERYLQSVERAGGIPVAISPSLTALDATLARLDGLLFAGGDDFDTERLGLGPVHPESTLVVAPKLDFDLALARTALASKLPILGVCYGMQLLGVVSGGMLWQHLPDDVPGSQEHRGGVRHSVQVVPGTKLAAALRVDSLDVVSRHHQALASLGPDFAVTARDDEGLIEAIEHTSHPFCLGVQWHPELAEPTEAHTGLFDALIAASQAHQTMAIHP